MTQRSLSRLTLATAAALVAVAGSAQAQSQADTATAPEPVTVENFIRAESDVLIGVQARDAGGVGTLFHRRSPASLDNQTIVRLNRDTLYSSAVFDLDAGPVEITLPETGDRYQSLQVISQDHYTTTTYGAGPHTISREEAGTRYVLVGIRTMVDPASPEDIAEVGALLDTIDVKQASKGVLELPQWDMAGLKTVRDALKVLGSTLQSYKKAFGTREEVDTVRHLLGSAVLWGGNAEKDAIYLNYTPDRNDGDTVYKLSVGDVPVDAFWSVSVYNAEGYFVRNDQEAYSINNLLAQKRADGGVDIQFGGCDGKIPNCLPVAAGWNYTVRLYRPRTEIVDGTWTFPDAVPVQ